MMEHWENMYKSFSRDMLFQTNNKTSIPFSAKDHLTDMSTWCLLVIITYLVFIRTRKKTSSQVRALPGPWSLPLIGDLHWMGSQPHLSLTRMQKHYGDIFRVKVGQLPVVVLSGLDTVKKALVDQSEVFAGRPSLFTFKFTSEGKTMCFNSYSETWKIHRRLAEKALKMVVSGTTFMDSIVQREATQLTDDLLATHGTALDPMEKLLWAIAHVKYSLCYGDSRDAQGDFERIIKDTLKLIGCHNNGNLMNFFPWSRYVFRKKFSELKDICDSMLHLTARKEAEHLDTYKAGQVRDALDALIQLGVETKCPLEQERVLHTVQEYLGAGLDISYCSMAWAILYLAKYRDIQEKIHGEIDCVIGSKDFPKLDHRQQMPYTQAFILEVLRHSSVIPFALPHSTMQDTAVNGFGVPKDSFVLVNLFSISRDPSLWECPNEFIPDRFLSADGTMVDTSLAERYIPFGVGKRKCVGEQFSRNEIFIFLTSLLQRCVIEKAAGVCDYSLEPEFGVILRPQAFKVSFLPR